MAALQNIIFYLWCSNFWYSIIFAINIHERPTTYVDYVYVSMYTYQLYLLEGLC